MRSNAPPPAMQSPSDDRNVRHSCGFAYNGYVWGDCPKCKAERQGTWALRCINCRAGFHAAEREDHCPKCDSGNTSLIASPDSRPPR